MRLIQSNILGRLANGKETLKKKGSLFLLPSSDMVRYDKVVVEDYDKDNLEDISIGSEVYIHKGRGEYLNDEELIFNRSDVILIK